MVSDYKITMEQAEYEMVCYRKVFKQRADRQKKQICA